MDVGRPHLRQTELATLPPWICKIEHWFFKEILILSSVVTARANFLMMFQALVLTLLLPSLPTIALPFCLTATPLSLTNSDGTGGPVVRIGGRVGTNISCAPIATDCATPWGGVVADGSSVTAYETATVPAGETCNQETRSCLAGTLGGSFTHESCTVETPPAIDCTTPWGAAVPDGDTITAYQNDLVPYGEVCNSEARTCTAGTLSGGFTHQACTVEAPNACTLPWGAPLTHGSSITAYQAASVPFGETCANETRTCVNSVLDGSFGFQSCNVEAPGSCDLPWGGTLEHSQTTTAYQAASVPFGSTCTSENRACTNGSLSGSYGFQVCAVGAPASCALPWGGTLDHGQTATAYQAASVPFGSTCTSQTRTCTNGSLSGTYGSQVCEVLPPENCTLSGVTVTHGTNRNFYLASRSCGATCASISQSRSCTNGTLGGTANYSTPSCPADTCANCTAPWGSNVSHGGSVTAYQSASVPFGSTCASQTRLCSDGGLSGSYTNQNCSVTPPANCTLPWGGSIAHAQSVAAYQTSSVPCGSTCASQTRNCSNGTLSGGYMNQSCSVQSCAITYAEAEAVCEARTESVGTTCEFEYNIYGPKKDSSNNWWCTEIFTGESCGINKYCYSHEAPITRSGSTLNVGSYSQNDRWCN